MQKVELKPVGSTVSVLSFSIAENWTELSKMQFKYYCALVVRNISVRKAHAEMLWKLSGLTRGNFIKNYPDYLCFCLNTVSWLFDKEQEITLTESHVPRIGVFVGPKAKLKNYNLEQLAFVDTLLAVYMQKPSKENEKALLGVVYRLPFVGFHKWAASFIGWCLYHFVGANKKQEAFINILGLVKGFKKQYSHVFTNQQQSQGKSFGWRGIMLDLANGPFGTFTQVEKTKASNALVWLEKLGVKREEAEREAELQKHKQAFKNRK